jgi:hypothetical protein
VGQAENALEACCDGVEVSLSDRPSLRTIPKHVFKTAVKTAWAVFLPDEPAEALLGELKLARMVEVCKGV